MVKEIVFVEDLTDLYKIKSIFNNEYLIGSKIFSGDKIINRQQISFDLKMLKELRDILNDMDLGD